MDMDIGRAGGREEARWNTNTPKFIPIYSLLSLFASSRVKKWKEKVKERNGRKGRNAGKQGKPREKRRGHKKISRK